MNKIPKDIIDTLKKLEESLWNNETRFSKKHMNQILAEDFVEFGRSGRIYKREDTLAVPENEALTEYHFENFQVRQIDENVFLVTYVSRVMFDELEIANRSSLWLKTSGGWLLQFHQGTPAKSWKLNF